MKVIIIDEPMTLDELLENLEFDDDDPLVIAFDELYENTEFRDYFL